MELQNKVLEAFNGKVVRKDLAFLVKGNLPVPTYVLEYLLGQYCATDDPTLIEDGINRVKDIIRNNYINRAEAEEVKGRIRELGTYRVIDKITAILNDKRDFYEASFANLGLQHIPIGSDFVVNNPKLLSGNGVWCIVKINYLTGDDVPVRWEIETLKPIQISFVDVEEYTEIRNKFTTEITALKDKVEEFTGNKVTAEKLADSIKLINNKRKALARLYECRKSETLPISGTDALVISQIAFYDDPARFTQMTNKLCDELEQRIKDGVSVVPAGTKRIMLTGTPLAIPNWKLHNIVETSGAVVVCEEMCTGTRYFENYVDETKETLEDQIMALSERYMNINCACFTPNHARIDDILRLAKEYKVDGIIDVNLKFCNLYDTEGYFVERAMKEAGIPVLGIETDYTDSDAQQLRTRVSAFVEMLNN